MIVIPSLAHTGVLRSILDLASVLQAVFAIKTVKNQYFQYIQQQAGRDTEILSQCSFERERRMLGDYECQEIVQGTF